MGACPPPTSPLTPQVLLTDLILSSSSSLLPGPQHTYTIPTHYPFYEILRND